MKNFFYMIIFVSLTISSLILTNPQTPHQAHSRQTSKAVASDSFCNEKEFINEKQNLCLLKADEYILRKTFWDEFVAVKNEQLSVDQLRHNIYEIIAQTDSLENKEQLNDYLKLLDVHFPQQTLGFSVLSQR
jgi:hypothetical protein